IAADSNRPRITSLTLILPTMSWSPSGVRAWTRNVRWSRDCRGSCRSRSSGSTGFHRANRSRDCSSARRYGAMSWMRTVLTRTRPPSACRTASSGDNNASQNDVLRRREDSNVGTRIRLVDNEISAGTLDQTWFAEPRSGTPARGGQNRGGGQARLDELGGLPGNQAMRKGATSIGAQIDGHARVMCCRDSLIAARVQVSHVRRVSRESALGASSDRRERVDVHQSRNDRNPLCGKGVDGVWRQPGGVLDAVDTRGCKVAKGLLAEAVGRHPGTLLVRGGDRGDQRLPRPAGAEVTGVPIDPVADQLDPAVTATRLLTDVLGQVLRLDLVGVVADVAPSPSDVPTRTHDARQVLTVVDPAGVGRRARIP